MLYLNVTELMIVKMEMMNLIAVSVNYKKPNSVVYTTNYSNCKQIECL